MVQKVIDEISNEAKQAIYYAVVSNSTSNMANIHLPTFIIKYLSKKGIPVGWFQKFLLNCVHKVEIF